MTTKYQDPIEALSDAASYDTLQKDNSTLLAAIEKVLAEGATAKQVEKRMMKRYGKDSLTALLVAGAAHHIQNNKPISFNCPKCNDTRPFTVTPGNLVEAGGWIACDVCGSKCDRVN